MCIDEISYRPVTVNFINALFLQISFPDLSFCTLTCVPRADFPADPNLNMDSVLTVAIPVSVRPNAEKSK